MYLTETKSQQIWIDVENMRISGFLQDFPTRLLKKGGHCRGRLEPSPSPDRLQLSSGEETSGRAAVKGSLGLTV